MTDTELLTKIRAIVRERVRAKEPVDRAAADLEKFDRITGLLRREDMAAVEPEDGGAK